jgi:hypothetical protein
MEVFLMEIATFVLVLCLSLILTVYNRRQAYALESMAHLEEDRAAREIKDRRERKAGELQVEPLRWLEELVNPLLDSPVCLVKPAKRVVAEVGTAELGSSDGRRLLVSTQALPELRRYDRRTRRSSGKGAENRLTKFAATSLLGNRWRIWKAPRTMADAGEFFDLEAQACGKSLGLDWGAPTRLWFYVIPG